MRDLYICKNNGCCFLGEEAGRWLRDIYVGTGYDSYYYSIAQKNGRVCGGYVRRPALILLKRKLLVLEENR